MPFVPFNPRLEGDMKGVGFVPLSSKEDPGLVSRALDAATSEAMAWWQNSKAGVAGFNAATYHETANAFMLLDRAAQILHDNTGMSKGGAFKKVEAFFRSESADMARFAEKTGGKGFFDKAVQTTARLPADLAKAGIATTFGGPVKGFAGLGALGRADEGIPGAAVGAAGGATIGKFLTGTAGVDPLKRATGLFAGGTTMALAEGAEPSEAILGGLVLGGLPTVMNPQGAARSVGQLGRKISRRAQQEQARIEAEATKTTEVSLREPVDGEPAAVKKAPVKAEPIVTLTEKAQVDPRAPEKTTEFLGRDYSDLELPKHAINLNLEKITGEKEFKQAITELSDVYRVDLNAARRNVVTDVEAKRLAEEMGMTLEQYLSQRKGGAVNKETLTAYRMMNRSVLEEWHKAGKQIKTGEATDQQKAEYIRLTALAERSMEITMGVTAEVSRATQSLKMEIGPSAREMRMTREAIKGFKDRGGKDLVEFADLVSEIDTPQGLAKAAKEMRRATTADKVMEVWYNALLSGPQTHIVNVSSNELVSYWAALETYAAATVGATRSAARIVTGRGPAPDRVYFREGTQRLYGIAQSGREGLVLAGKVWKTGEGFDPASKAEHLRHQAIGGHPEDSRVGKFLGPKVRVPGRALMSADEFYKARGRRQELNALAMREGIKKKLSGKELNLHNFNFVRNPPEWAVEKSIHAARKQTFTEELGRRGKGVQEAFSHPLGRLIVPFVRVMTNIFKFSAEASPLGFFMESVRTELKAGGARRDAALGRMAFATSVGAWVASETAAGNITGSGPSNPELRRTWYAAGNRPYSIKVPFTGGPEGERWVSYARLEPVGTIFGVAADFAEISGHIESEGSEELAAKIAMAISLNITSKTFMQGATGVALMMSDPARYGGRFWQKLAGTLIPTGVAQVARVHDPILREVRSTIDAIKNRIPAYKEDLKPRRNIWGEPIFLDGGWGPDLISPFYSHRKKPDFVSSEAWRVRARFSSPPRTVAGVKLSVIEYDQLSKETGQLAKKNITDSVNSPAWRHMPDYLQKDLMENTYRQASEVARQSAELRLLGTRAPDVMDAQIERLGIGRMLPAAVQQAQPRLGVQQ
jgi:hypothetical protein